MVKAFYSKISDEGVNIFSLRMRGHADYEEYGKDIVCSAISILTYSLANILADDYAEVSDINIEEGSTDIECRSNDEQVEAYFDFAVKGLDLLSEEYPDYVYLVDRYGVGD